MESIPQAFLESASRHAERPAIVEEGSTRSYGRLASDARRLGRLIRRTARGRNVAVILPTCKEFYSVYLGTLLAGKVPVPINFLLQRDEVRFILQDAGADTVVTAGFFRELIPERGVRPLYLDELGLLERAAALVPPLPGARPGLDEPATLLYTSGTTDRPKGVVLTHRNLLANSRASALMAGLDRPLKFLGALPLFHSFALTCTLLIPLLYGGTVVVHKRFNPRRALESVEREGVEVLLAVPSMYRLLLKAQEADPVDVSSVRIAVAGGEPLPRDLARRFEEVFRFPLLEGYGLTEASPVISLNTPQANRSGTAGRALPILETRIVDLEGEGDLPPGAVGELWVRGETVMRGYHNRPEETSAALTPEGWLRTGDLATRDEEGYIAIRGREKDLIIVAGENVSPGEIEDAVASHPDVFEAAVMGEPDESRGEVPVAYVVLRDGARATSREILDHCRRRLAGFKVPRRLVLRPELPHGPTGKILKRKIREEVGEEAGSEGAA